MEVGSWKERSCLRESGFGLGAQAVHARHRVQVRRQASLRWPVVGHHSNAVVPELGLQLAALVVEVLELAAGNTARFGADRSARLLLGQVKLFLEAEKGWKPESEL